MVRAECSGVARRATATDGAARADGGHSRRRRAGADGEEATGRPNRLPRSSPGCARSIALPMPTTRRARAAFAFALPSLARSTPSAAHTSATTPARRPTSPCSRRRFAAGLAGRRSRPEPGESGLQIVDARAARYGEFDELQIVGPDRRRVARARPPQRVVSVVAACAARAAAGCRRSDAARAGRARRRPARRSRILWHRLPAACGCPPFALENDAVVEPSILLDDVPSVGARDRSRG